MLSWRPDAGYECTPGDSLATGNQGTNSPELIAGHAGCAVAFDTHHPSAVSLAWIRDISLTVPADGSWRLTGGVTVTIGSDTGVLAGLLHAHEHPLEPVTTRGTYLGYDGPCPPWNDARVHRYRFGVQALDVASLDVPERFTLEDVRQAAAGHVLAEVAITGRYTLNARLSS